MKMKSRIFQMYNWALLIDDHVTITCVISSSLANCNFLFPFPLLCRCVYRPPASNKTWMLVSAACLSSTLHPVLCAVSYISKHFFSGSNWFKPVQTGSTGFGGKKSKSVFVFYPFSAAFSFLFYIGIKAISWRRFLCANVLAWPT